MLCISKTWLQLFKVSAHSGLNTWRYRIDLRMLRFDSFTSFYVIWCLPHLKQVLANCLSQICVLAWWGCWRVQDSCHPRHSCHVKPWTSSLTTRQALIGVNPGPEPYTQFETLPVSRTLEPEVLRRHNVLETGQSIEFLTKLAVKLFNFECSQMLVWKYLSSGLSMATSFTSFAAFSCPRLCPTLCTGRTSFFRKLHSHSQLHLVPILSSLRWDILRNFCTIHLGLLSGHKNESCSCLWY